MPNPQDAIESAVREFFGKPELAPTRDAEIKWLRTKLLQLYELGRRDGAEQGFNEGREQGQNDRTSLYIYELRKLVRNLEDKYGRGGVGAIYDDITDYADKIEKDYQALTNS